MNNQELLNNLEKSGITTTNTGGLLNTQQANKFIDTTIDQSGFLKEIRVERNIGISKDLDFAGVSRRLIHASTENTAPADNLVKGITTGKRTLTPVEVMLPYNISLKYLEENIEQENAEATINKIFTRQFSNDLVDLAFNGNIATPVDAPDRTFLSITDSIFAHLNQDERALYFDRVGSNDWLGFLFPGMLNMLPDKHKSDIRNLSFLVSYNTMQQYISQLTERSTALGDMFLSQGKAPYYRGIKIEAVPFMPENKAMLTSKKNLAVGFGRDITVYRLMNPRARRLEYTITAKVDFDYILTDLITFTE